MICSKGGFVHGQFTRKGGYSAAQALIANKDIPEALFCGNDEMAIGALEAFNDADIKVPERIAIAGFDDIELSTYVNPPLTTVNILSICWVVRLRIC